MRISKLLKENDYSISFEVFPPKPGALFDSVMECTSSLAALKPDFCSVTYGASGNTAGNTVKVVKYVQDELGMTPLAHLTCVQSSKEDIDKVLAELKDAGIVNIMALRGDLPKDMEDLKTDFKYASELIEYIKSKGDFCIGGACYPEGHPESPDKHSDIENLKRKVKAGAEFLTTQMFFDNNIFYNFMYRVRDVGIEVPIVPGIMPLTSSQQISRIKELSGANLPPTLLAMADKFRDNPEAMKQAGIVFASLQILDLISNGIRAFHIYTMNKAEIYESIYENVRSAIGR